VSDELGSWLDSAGCPRDRPPYAAMAAHTRQLHDAIDAHARRSGVPYLHPDSPTLQLDVVSSSDVVSWQERKAELLFLGEGCWSELPHLYARYGTGAGRTLIARVRELEGAAAALVTDSGMQATALVFDALMTPGAHAVCMEQVYNKSKSYLEWLASRLGGGVTFVPDGDLAALERAIEPQTALVFAETFTNPLMRAQDPQALGALALAARRTAPSLELVIDNTIATPWGLATPLLAHPGIDIVVASATKAIGGRDQDLGGYIATSHIDVANQLMDLMAMRGGILDWRRSAALADGLDEAAAQHLRRCESAALVARFLATHPRVEHVFHPSLPDHPDRRVIDQHYRRSGSLLSFRVAGADEEATRRFTDALATTVVVRYALSFDGLTTKVNHHKTVSEYFTQTDRLAALGLDRLVRLALGVEDPNDIIAALNWALHHGLTLSSDELAAWRSQRLASLGL
jgi:cystathionine beta-lyase/cystathionine gamma-synthase